MNLGYCLYRTASGAFKWHIITSRPHHFPVSRTLTQYPSQSHDFEKGGKGLIFFVIALITLL